jgi:hypothetical protein
MPSCSACRRKGIVSLRNKSVFAGLASRKNLCVKCRCTIPWRRNKWFEPFQRFKSVQTFQL